MLLPRRVKNITGQKFNKLTALRYVYSGGLSRQAFWEFQCDCGKTIIVGGSYVWKDEKKSCGCYTATYKSEASTIHGRAGTRVYMLWLAMKMRCNTKKGKSYTYYGARGITFCKRWAKFIYFYTDMGDPPTNKHSLDRINNNKGYSKRNCRWATIGEQLRNSRRNRNYTFKGKTQCQTDWAREYGMHLRTLKKRLQKWSLEKALTTPIDKSKRRYSRKNS